MVSIEWGHFTVLVGCQVGVASTPTSQLPFIHRKFLRIQEDVGVFSRKTSFVEDDLAKIASVRVRARTNKYCESHWGSGRRGLKFLPLASEFFFKALESCINK